MTWNDCLELGATKLAAMLGCPVTTAHTWIRRSGPPDWQKDIFLAVIVAHMQADQPVKKARKKAGG